MAASGLRKFNFQTLDNDGFVKYLLTKASVRTVWNFPSYVKEEACNGVRHDSN